MGEPFGGTLELTLLELVNGHVQLLDIIYVENE